MEEERFKVILIGDASVGKTSIARRQANGVFDFKMMSTVGVDHLVSTIEIDGRPIRLMLWDTAGQEQFASLVPMYVRGAHACVIVASVVDPDSCAHMEEWLRLLQKSGENPPVIVAINKTDLLDGAPITTEEIRAKYGGTFPTMFFVSARTGDSILPLFQQVGMAAIDRGTASRALERGPVEKKENGDGACC
jgi:small GTP-binding protein